MEKTNNDGGLKYIGQASILGIPARDLTPAEISALPMSRLALLATGLYSEIVTRKAYTPKPTKAALKGGVEAENKE